MARGGSGEALLALAMVFLAGIACAQVEVFNGAGLGNALGQPQILNAQQPVSLEQQQPVIFQQQQQPLRHHSFEAEDPFASFQQQQQQALTHHSFEAEDPLASLQHQHQHHHSFEAQDPLASLEQPAGSVSLQQLQQPAGSFSLQEQPAASLQQQQALGVPALQGSASPLDAQAVSLPLQQVPVLAARPSALTVLPIQPTGSRLAEPSAQLQERPEDVLEEEAAMASAAMAETMMQSLGQALTQPAPHNARAGLQRQRMADPEGGGILEELAKLVESALFPEPQAPALAPGPAAASAVAGMPSIALPQAFASQQAPQQSSQEPDDITVVKVQQSLADPNIERVQVVSLKKLPPQSKGSSFQAQAAAPQMHPHLTSAAMRAQAQAAQAQPTAKNFEAVPKGAGRTHEQSFKEMKHKAAGQAEQRSFEAEVAKELYRLANAPASEYEEIDAPDLAPAAGEQPMQAPAAAPVAAPVQAPHSAPKAAALQSNAIKAHTVPGVSFISNRNARRALRASGATHPAVIWQSHLLDVSPQQWNTLKSSYISGIAQGANVGKDQVIILGVTSGTSVTVNTQIIYYNDDTSAAGELKNALADQQSSPVYIPNFGNVQVSGVTQANVPIATPSPPPATAAATANYVAYTPASFSAPGPAAAQQTAAAPGQQTAPSQQAVTPIVQTMSQDASTDSSIAPVIRSQQVYKNNGLPVGAAVGVPLGAIVLAAGLLYLAHLNRKRTARLIQEYTEPMIRKDPDMSPHGSLASQAAPPPRRNTPSPKVSPKASPRPSPSKV